MASLAEIRKIGDDATTGVVAKLLLGEAFRRLNEGYGKLSDVGWLEQDDAKRLLDQANAYAQGVFALLPSDSEPLDETTRGRVGAALYSIGDSLAVIDEAIGGETLVQTYAKALRDVLSASSGFVGGVAAAITTPIVRQTWPLIAAALAITVIVFLWRRTA